MKRASVFGGSILLVEIRSPPSPCKSPICTREPGLGLEGAPRYPRATRQPLGLLWSLCVKAFESRLSVECAKAGMPRQRRELMEVGIDTTQQQLPFLPFLRGGARLLCSRSITYGGKYSDACMLSESACCRRSLALGSWIGSRRDRRALKCKCGKRVASTETRWTKREWHRRLRQTV